MPRRRLEPHARHRVVLPPIRVSLSTLSGIGPSTVELFLPVHWGCFLPDRLLRIERAEYRHKWITLVPACLCDTAQNTGEQSWLFETFPSPEGQRKPR